VCVVCQWFQKSSQIEDIKKEGISVQRNVFPLGKESILMMWGEKREKEMFPLTLLSDSNKCGLVKTLHLS